MFVKYLPISSKNSLPNPLEKPIIITAIVYPHKFFEHAAYIDIQTDGVSKSYT